MLHFGAIRKYTQALLEMFSNLEVQYMTSNGTISKNVPIRYTAREKAKLFDENSTEQLLNGNYNVLPRANLSFATMIKSETRQTNKQLKLNTVKSEDTFDFVYNAVPYEFTFDLTIMCRGMNEATMLIEQIVPLFNPIYNIDILEVPNLNEPTRIPVSLLDIGIESEEYEELSTNITKIYVGLGIKGNIYPPIKSIPRIKDFKIYLNEQIGVEFDRKSIFDFNVIDNETEFNSLTQVQDTKDYAPVIFDIVSTEPVIIGDNDLIVVFEDKDNKLSELTFEYTILFGNAEITNIDYENFVLTVNESGDIEVQVTITDYHNNYTSFSKTFSA